MGFPCGSAGKESAPCRRLGFDPWVGKIPWRRERLPTPVSWPGEFHGWYIHGVKKSQTWLSDFPFYLMNLFIFFYQMAGYFFILEETQHEFSRNIPTVFSEKKICSPSKWFIIIKMILSMKKKYFHYYKI